MGIEKLETLKRKELIQIIDKYYKSINRLNPPNFKEYTNHELKQVIKMFSISLN